MDAPASKRVVTADDLPDEIREIFADSLAAGIPASLIMQTVNEITHENEDTDAVSTREAWVGPEPERIPVFVEGHPRLVADDAYDVLMEAARKRRRPDRAKRVGVRASAAFPKLDGFTVPCVGPGEIYVLTLVDDHNADLLAHGHEAFIHQWVGGRDLDRMLLRWRGTATTLQDRGRFVLGLVHARADLRQSIKSACAAPIAPEQVRPQDRVMIFDLDGRVHWQRTRP